MNMPMMKDGELLSPTYLDFVRSLPCAVCCRQPRNEAHHYPSRGASGATNDLRSMPVCRECHLRCEGANVVVGGRRMPPVPAAEQAALVAATFFKFLEGAGRWHVVEQVLRDIKRWRESRVFTEMVPE